MSAAVPRWFLAAALLAIATRVTLEVWRTAHPPPEPPHPIAWQTLEGARARSAVSGKPVFVEATADWCIPCRRLDLQTLRDPDFAAWISERFEPVRIEDSDETAAPFRREHEIQAYPTLLVLAPGLDRPSVQVGYAGTTEVRSFLEGARLRAIAAQRRRGATPSR